MQIQFEISREELHVIYIFYVSVYKTPLTLATLTSEKTLFLSGHHYSGLGNLGQGQNLKG